MAILLDNTSLDKLKSVVYNLSIDNYKQTILYIYRLYMKYCEELWIFLEFFCLKF